MDRKFMIEYVKAVEERTGEGWDYDTLSVCTIWPWMNGDRSIYIVKIDEDCAIQVYNQRTNEFSYDHELGPADTTTVYAEMITKQFRHEQSKRNV